MTAFSSAEQGSSGNARYPNTATHTCEPGYDLIGDSVRVCNTLGEWTYPLSSPPFAR